MKKILSALNWFFVKAGMSNMVIIFILSLALLFAASLTNISILSTIGFILLILAAAMLIIGMVIAWVIVPLKNKKKK